MLAEHNPSSDLTMAVSLMFHDPQDSTHGIAIENAERYGRSVTVQFTGKVGNSVDKQVKDTAEVVLRVGHLVVDQGFTPPGRHLLIKMALRKKDGWFINTFSVRYEWADVLRLAKARAPIAEVATKGKIEKVWLEYWPTMCLNQPPRELFDGGDGEPEEPENVENPKGKDLSCHRRR